MRRPKITQKVIEGIITSTSEHLAGSPETLGFGTLKQSVQAFEEMGCADSWARGMREWMIERGTWKETKES